jgi:hypothetical protein
MAPRTRNAFLALILVQAAHSMEEYVFALYDVFAPARFASSLVSSNLAVGFALLNAGLLAFGAWCYLARVRPDRPSARGWIWPWVLIELSNGIGHSAMAIVRGSYFPGVATAPVLFLLAAFLAAQLARGQRSSRRAAV